MKCRCNLAGAARGLVLAALPLTVIGLPALADTVPESIRIQEKAEKAYENSPVVPIERGNAHHRDQLRDDEQGSGDGAVPNVPPRAKDDRRGSDK